MTGHARKVDADLNGGNPETISPPEYVTIPDWNKHYPWPPLAGMRHLRFHGNTNGFAPAFKKVGSRVLVHVPTFWAIVEKK